MRDRRAVRWDDADGLVYVGIAGRNPAGKGLASRLRSHASGRRSGDQFCVYVADHYVLPELTRDQIEAIRDSRLSMDALVREKIHAAFGFRFVVVDDYRTAIPVENTHQERASRRGSAPPQPLAVGPAGLTSESGQWREWLPRDQRPLRDLRAPNPQDGPAVLDQRRIHTQISVNRAWILSSQNSRFALGRW